MSTFGPDMPVLTELAPGVRRLLAPNPSMMTGPGTNTYLIGKNELAVLDPGPMIESHIEKIQKVALAPIRWVMVTHTHPDHSPAARDLARLAGAELIGMPPPKGQHQDTSFAPDRVLEDGERLRIDGVEVEAIHTPGHASNHVCYLETHLNWVFTGDHVIDGSTVVINPPDGDMKHYLQSLEKIKRRRPDALAPGHGELIREPDRAIEHLIDHRLHRESKVAAALSEHPGLTSMELVPKVYQDVDPKLYGLAERSLLAHLLKLADDGSALKADGRWFKA